MYKIFKYNLVLICTLLLSCFEEDKAIPPHRTGDEITAAMPVTIYNFQAYFDLHTNAFLKTNCNTDWDLGFEASENGWHIILNSSRFMRAANTLTTDFEAVNSAKNLLFVFDKSDGNPDSTAIGNWADSVNSNNPKFNKYVYVIDRGYDETGDPLGYKKVQFFDLKDGVYTFRFANLNGTDDITHSIEKDSVVNYVLFSFDNGGNTHTTQPPKTDWDLLFTKYTTMLFENDTIPTPYLVRGVLLNNFRVEAAVDSIRNFRDIDYETVNQYSFSTPADIIGYDWKVFGNDAYTVREHINYIIKDTEGYYFKLRFIDFYNDSGERGYPKFEFQRL